MEILLIIGFSKDPPTDAEKDQREKSALRSFQKIIALRYYNKNWDQLRLINALCGT